jgi:thioredoxin 1
MKGRIEEQEQIAAFLTGQCSGLVYFYTPMCGTCQMAGKMLKVVEELIPEIPSVKVNLNYHPSSSTEFSIESVPCLLLLKGGEIKDKIYAFQSVPYLLDRIRFVF